MMHLLYGYNQIVAKFVANVIPDCKRGFGNCTAIGVIDGQDGKLVAGLVSHNWSPEADTIEMSGAALTKRWLP